MIEETRKKDNQGFGQEVVKAAQAVREKREGKNVKKDFLLKILVKIICGVNINLVNLENTYVTYVEKL